MHRISSPSIRWICLAIAGSIVLTALVLVLAWAQPAQANVEPAPPSQDDQPSNAYCLTCHVQYGLTQQLPSGEVLDVNIDPSIYGGSVHG